MDWLNYHHLHCFWIIAREGSLTAAARELHVTHSTLSAQLRALEDFLGENLFERKGRRLVLTPFGTEMAQYAEDIFRLGAELVDVARGRARPHREVFRVGVLGSLPKTIVYRVLEPVFQAAGEVALEIRHGDFNDLLGTLSRNQVQMVLADQAPERATPYRVHSHLLGDTGMILYGTRGLAARYEPGFPASLQGAPLILPPQGTNLRRAIDRWLAEKAIDSIAKVEVDDAGLMRTFGALGRGLFPVREVLAPEVEETHHVRAVGSLEGVREPYYVISLERRVRHPLVATIIERARLRLGIAPG